MTRPYRLGKRQAAADATRQAVLRAARELVASGSAPSVGEIARRAGVSRVTVYNRFGGRSNLLAALQPGPSGSPPAAPTARQALRAHLEQACHRWAADASLYRNLGVPVQAAIRDEERRLAERLAAESALRPGCSLKEAQDVIATVSSFAVFDGLHGDGRRSPAAVLEILLRLAGAILAS